MTDTATSNGKTHTHDQDAPMNRRLFEGLLDETLTALKGDSDAYRSLTDTLKDALAAKDPAGYLRHLDALVQAATKLPGAVVANAITNVRQDHGLTGATAKTTGKK